MPHAMILTATASRWTPKTWTATAMMISSSTVPPPAGYAAAFPTTAGGPVCGGGECTGYELSRPLDFDDPDSYASEQVNTDWTRGGGWTPILQCQGYARGCTRKVTLTFDGLYRHICRMEPGLGQPGSGP